MIRKNFVAALFFAIASTLYAQNGYTTQERIALDNALTILENYEVSASVIDDDSYYEFISLFKNDNMPVYNDILGAGENPTLTVKEYADFQRNEARNKQVFISNIKKQRLWIEDDIYKMEYTFDKSVSYGNGCGVHFDSKDYYGENYKMTAIIAFDEEANNAYIESLTGKINSDKPKSFYVLKRTNSRDNDLKFNGEKVTLNAFDQAYLGKEVSKNMFQYADPDVIVTPHIDNNCKTVTVDYKARKIMIKPRFNLGIGNALKCENSDWLSEIKSKAQSFGLDFGFIIPSKSALKVGVCVGAAFSTTTLNMAYNNSNYTYRSYADVDGDSYYRHYENLSLAQDLKLTELIIPVYIDLNIKMGRIISFYIDLGANLNLNLSAKPCRVEGSAHIYGVYPQYSDLVLDENWGFNGFGNMNYTESNLTNDVVPNLQKFTIDLQGAAGFRIGIPSTPLSIDLGAGYVMGLTPIIKESDQPIHVDGTGTPLVFNTISGKNSTEYLHYFTEGFGKVKRQGLQINMGLSLKF